MVGLAWISVSPRNVGTGETRASPGRPGNRNLDRRSVLSQQTGKRAQSAVGRRKQQPESGLLSAHTHCRSRRGESSVRLTSVPGALLWIGVAQAEQEEGERRGGRWKKLKEGLRIRGDSARGLVGSWPGSGHTIAMTLRH